MSRLHGDVFAGPGLTDFAVNILPSRRLPRLQRAMLQALDDHRYPDQSSARQAIAESHGRDPGDVLLSNGASEIFWLLAHALRPRRAACVDPSFTEPHEALRAVGADVSSIIRDPAGDWTFDPGGVARDVEMVVVGNPNNPTGTIDDRQSLLSLRAPGRLVVIDESFMDFAVDRSASLAQRPVDGVAVVGSLTKLWGLAGIRAGYLLAEPTLIQRLEDQRQPWPVNAVALAAMTFCAADRQTPRRVAAEVARARSLLTEALRALPGLQVYDSQVNFLLLKSERGADVVGRLRQHGVAVRPAGDFASLTDDFFRVAVRTPDENAMLVATLREVLS